MNPESLQEKEENMQQPEIWEKKRENEHKTTL